MDYESWAKEYESEISNIDKVIIRLRGDKSIPIKDLNIEVRRKLSHYWAVRRELTETYHRLLLRCEICK